MQNRLEYEFFMSQINFIKDIKENERIKISLVFHEGIQGPCVLKICKNRNLAEVCQKLREIRHPNVAVVYDAVYANNHTYIIEEFIDGHTLQEVVENQGLFSEKETAEIMIKVCEGLEKLHRQHPPIVHNDINTSNIIIRKDGNVKLFDFDISRTFKSGANKNTRLFGTEEYAAPEHFGYGQSEPRTDIYSLGVTMHEMLTGNHLTNEHKMTYKGNLKKIIRKCIEISPKKRYPSARQLGKALKKYQRRRCRFLKATAFLLIVLAAAAGLFYMSRKEADHLRTADVSEQNDVSVSNEDHSTNDNIGAPDKEIEAEPEKEVQVRKAPELKMENVYEVTGELYSMVALNDGVFVTLESEGEDFFIKTSDGTTRKLEEIEGWYGAKLVYNTYSDELYIFDFSNYDIKIYQLQDDFTTSFVAVIDERFWSDRSDLPCNFFSDGNMVLNQIFGIVDSETWTILGGAPGVVYVINDRMYQRNEPIFFAEVDAGGNIIAEYDSDEFSGIPYENEIYIDGQYAYFLGSKYNSNEEWYDYVYRFDGETYEEVVCLNDYKYYSSFACDYLCVTDQAIRCYDTELKVIKEFQLN